MEILSPQAVEAIQRAWQAFLVGYYTYGFLVVGLFVVGGFIVWVSQFMTNKNRHS